MATPSYDQFDTQFGVNVSEKQYQDARRKAQERALGAFRLPDVLSGLLNEREKVLPGLQEERRGLISQRDTLVPTKRQALHGEVTDPFAVEAELSRQESNVNRALSRIQDEEGNRKQDIQSILDKGQSMYGLETTTAQNAVENSKDALDRALGRAKEERDFSRQKELKSMSGGGSGGLTDLQLLGLQDTNPLGLAQMKGYTRQLAPDGGKGYWFYNKEGQPVSVDEVANAIGGNKAALLEGSSNTSDQATIKEASGKSALSAAAQKDINSIGDAMNVLGKIESSSKAINTYSGPMARGAGISSSLKGYAGMSADATRFRQNVGYLSRIVRAMGEVGTLNEGDIARANKLIPAFTDTAEEAQNKIRDLKDILEKNRQSRLTGATPDIVDMTLQDVVDTGI